MYTGTLIDDLIATVERAEERAEEHDNCAESQTYWQQAATYELKVTGQNLLGVA